MIYDIVRSNINSKIFFFRVLSWYIYNFFYWKSLFVSISYFDREKYIEFEYLYRETKQICFSTDIVKFIFIYNENWLKKWTLYITKITVFTHMQTYNVLCHVLYKCRVLFHLCFENDIRQMPELRTSPFRKQNNVATQSPWKKKYINIFYNILQNITLW